MAAKWFNYLRLEEGPQEGLNPAWWLYHRSLARTVKRHPYLLANEWIASNIAQHMRLPIPPFALMRKSGVTTRYFASLDYGKKESPPTDMKPAILCNVLPHVATGIVVFDMLIGNFDRHEGNVKVDNPLQPTSVELIDHDLSLFGEVAKRGIERLGSIEGKLGFTKLGNNYEMHKLGKELKTGGHFEYWLERAEDVPESFIRDIVSESADLGLTADEAQCVAQFLLRRKQDLRDILKANKSFFPISDWGLFQ